jgi:DNA mismatch repair protein MutS2
MQAGVLKGLEFDRIVEAVRRYAQTPLGAARLGELRPSSDVGRVEAGLQATSEGVLYLAEKRVLAFEASADLEPALASLAVQGRALGPRHLLALGSFLASVETTRQALRRDGARFPVLRAIAETARSFDREIADVLQKITEAGEVDDNATPELRSIRDRIRKQRARLRSVLESYLRGKDTAKYLQEDVVTDRHGRYVLVVKTEHRAAIAGIIHGSSASGASLYLEPLSTVEINNDVVALEEQEAEEVHRILLALSNAFRSRAADLQRTLEAATELDVIQAKARLAETMDAVKPVLSAEPAIALQAARHPLLMKNVLRLLDALPEDHARVPAQPVPVDITVLPPARVLVISGPNTGGKTVALKTAGLLTLMAQAGLHVPAAEGSRLPVFRSIFADIGDEQSIAASLSTFSAHVTNIVGMDRALQLPALVLLDEIGAGTDPAEGGALGMALLEHFKRRGAIVLASTHYDVLKSYASTTDGVISAAFGFNTEDYTPTYQLLYGSPGRSLALEIAARLGVPPAVIDEARQHRSAREAQLAEHLEKIDRDLAALEHDRRLLETERRRIQEAETRVAGREESVRQREVVFRRRVDERLDEALRGARREIDDVVQGLKEQAARLSAEVARRGSGEGVPLSTGETGALRADARSTIDALVRRFERDIPRDSGSPDVQPAAAASVASTGAADLHEGDRVLVGGFGMEGIVRFVHDRDADVEVNGKRLRIGLRELRPVAGSGRRPEVRVNVELQPREELPSDLNVIGCSVDEALTRAERFLDSALIGEQRTLRVIHGYGTGQLRRAIADFLQRHPLVASFGAAPPEQGGGGVTVVELRE